MPRRRGACRSLCRPDTAVYTCSILELSLLTFLSPRTVLKAAVGRCRSLALRPRRQSEWPYRSRPFCTSEQHQTPAVLVACLHGKRTVGGQGRGEEVCGVSDSSSGTSGSVRVSDRPSRSARPAVPLWRGGNKQWDNEQGNGQWGKGKGGEGGARIIEIRSETKKQASDNGFIRN